MLNITDLKVGTKFIYGGDPYLVLSYSQSKMGRGGSVVKVKIRNLKTGAQIDKTFQGAETLQPASISYKKAQFLYLDNSKAHFMDSENFDQFQIPLAQLGSIKNLLVENTPINVLYFDNEPINIELPIKMKFKVISAPPAIKGNSAGSITKKVTISTGLKIDVPIFIKEDDIIVIDSRDGKYIERG